jgi:Domain of unknown function (DUF1905)
VVPILELSGLGQEWTGTRSGARSWRWAMAHKLPVKADVRKSIGKQAGDTVTVCLGERLDT